MNRAKTRLITIEVICAVLLALFLYAVGTKLLNPYALRHDMLNQPFPRWFTRQLIWMVPSIEILIIIMLIPERLRGIGLMVCFSLMLLFSVYAALILLKFFPYVPCGCGGVIRNLSWPQHMVFNLFFTFITAIAIWLRRKAKLDEGKVTTA